ncbi:hypothetical protein [Sedimenticola selenatireducens]|uniref:hypothetical protein n=1 Tax=Sedimenticola selenatireducens TaxID=191960 RepID=UPI002AAABC9F|nr:hypothetical protein [Sedimenticola selenatireducens]
MKDNLAFEAFPDIKRLQETIDKRLGFHEECSGSKRNRVNVSEAGRKAANKILNCFDAENLPRLLREARQLSAGSGMVSDAAVPAVYERTVIREALYAMKGLEFVDAGEQAYGPTVSIPFSYRDPSAADRSNTRVYEGQEIQRSGVIQSAEETYPIPQKLSFSVSDEMRHLTSASHINWDTMRENALNASRIVSEDTDHLILNEMLHSSDEYAAVAVAGEDLEPQADGVKSTFVLAKFPVVRPRKAYDIQGNQVGVTTNPISVIYNAVALSEYNGSGLQTPGTYYRLDYNQGEIQLVDELGDLQIPADGTSYTISYSYSPNVYAFDTDVGSLDVDEHWDQFLYRYGLRKAALEDDRRYTPDFGLMSGTAMSHVEQAKKFSANFKVPGTDLSLDGDLGRIKDVPNYKTAGPGLWYGDQRILIGQKGITRYRMLKPWVMNGIENQRGPNGRYTGQKEAYGDQFIAVHTPTPLKGAFTSLVLYSSSGRVAR